MIPSLDGVYCFGQAVHIEHLPTPRVGMRTTVFGLTGVFRLDGGGRGRRFLVTGVLEGISTEAVMGAEAALLAFADGACHQLVDTQGRVWPNVMMPGTYRPSPEGPKSTDYGWSLAYELDLEALT